MVTTAPALDRPTVPRLLPAGGTVVCLGTGPSLTADDVAYCEGRAVVIAVNDAVRWAPFADALMASDASWWGYHTGCRSFAGLKYSLDRGAAKWSDVVVLQNTGCDGIETQPHGLRTGKNSGYAAMNLAVHLGATRILLLGYDMRVGPQNKMHFFGDHPRPLRNNSPFKWFQQAFGTAVEPLRALGIEIVNCSRESALRCFPRQPLREALR